MKESPSPVAFLLGIPRSGTTLLSLLLNQHPAIHCPQEPWLLLGLDMLGRTHPEHPADAPLLAGLLDEFLGAERQAALNAAGYAIYRKVLEPTGKALLVDKTPRYYQCLDLLESMFDASKGIWLQRNPLDVAASFRTSWNIDLPKIIRDKEDTPFLFDYVLGNRHIGAFAQRHPMRIIHYEDLVNRPESEIAGIFEHLGLNPHPISTHVDQQAAGYAQSAFADKKIFSGHAVHTRSIDSYKTVFNGEEVALLLGALGRESFERLGYDRVWEEACRTFSLSTVADCSEELGETAERHYHERLAMCKASANTYQLAENARRVEWEVKQLAEAKVWLTGENAALTEHRDQVLSNLNETQSQLNETQSQLNETQAQLNALLDRGIRARAADLGRHIRDRLKKMIRAGIWRFVETSPPPVLPRITVVTPVFNGAAHIAETLESVLRQDYPDLEYIIVDGGSTDETLDIIRRYREDKDAFPQRIAEVISDPDQGMYDAIAKGFERGTGEIQCYLNADDTLLAGRLRAVGEYFATHPSTQAIYHEDIVYVDGWLYPNVRQPERVDLFDLLDGHILFQDGVFWRRAVYAAIGGVRRDLRLAGDFDLWLRMATQAVFVRQPGHVSCFRIRPGQLSERMMCYHREMQHAIADLHAGTPKWRRALWPVGGVLRRCMRALGRMRRPDRLFFPIDFANMPPPTVRTPPPGTRGPRSPIDGEPAEQLLFSTPDTRFGEQELNYIYLDTRHGIAITHPPIPPARLDMLYRTHYSNPPTELRQAAGTSPYRNFNRRSRWEKLILRLPVEKLRLVPADAWEDHTLDELEQVLRAAGVDTGTPLRFLDTGCFEGHLLDRIHGRTAWRAWGLEPNAQAVAVASAKGHRVWQGHAEDAVDILPADSHFDVVFMGQSIEHVDDPVRVLRRLRLLLAPGGVLAVSTPNLDSREIDWFGPTWAHWHPPYHRHIFSRRGMEAVARQAGLALRHFRSFSHPYWTTMSFAQNGMGLGGSASHAVNFARHHALRAQRAQFLKRLLWDRLGKGDYFFVVMQDGEDG